MPNTTLERLKRNLSAQDAQELAQIWEPRAVMTPPIDTRCGMCVMPDGEIRYYGFDKKFCQDYSTQVYWASRDCGLSWKKYRCEGGVQHGSALCSPYSGRYITLVHPDEPMSALALPQDAGLNAVVSKSPAATDFRLIPVTQDFVSCMYLPIAMRSRKRLVCAAHQRIADGFCPVVVLSDDDGESWRVIQLKQAPRHEAVWPHSHCRWQNDASEPTVAELSDGSLLLLARTSLDVLYEYHSPDGGETWTDPKPSTVHSTLTSPTLFTLSDGRLMLFWCNTQPLPEMDPALLKPQLRHGELDGTGGEDFFTNRDACHAAISEDDGCTWIGMREVWLNGIRNRSDYRSLGGSFDTLDKSVHQFQAIELPGHKVLLSLGQHPRARQAVIFDVDWLYETEWKEDFTLGLDHVTTHVFVRSVPGNFRGVAGHCSLNRTHGALLMPDPDGIFEEALFLSTIEDPRLLSPLQGVVWNFPAGKEGCVSVDLRILGEGLRISLCDRWLHPADKQVRFDAACSMEITRDMMLEGWTHLEWAWSEERVQLLRNGALLLETHMAHRAPNGISYFHIQTLTRQADPAGAWIKRMEKR
jgi:hypothetical protein